MRILYWAVVAFLMTGCAAPPVTQENTASGVRREASKFDKLVTYNGPEVLEYVQRGILNDHLRWRIRAVAMAGSNVAGGYRLVASVWHQDSTWRNYRSASFVGGNVAQTIRVESKPSCMGGGGLVTCSFTEAVSVPITPEQWSAAKLGGIEIRLNADRGPAVVVKVPSAYVAGFDTAIRPE